MASREDADNARKAYGRRSRETSREIGSSQGDGTASGPTSSRDVSQLPSTRPPTPPQRRIRGSGTGSVPRISQRSPNDTLPLDHIQLIPDAHQELHVQQLPTSHHVPYNQARRQLYSGPPPTRDRISTDSSGIDSGQPDVFPPAQIDSGRVAVQCRQDLVITIPTSSPYQIPLEGCRVRFRKENDDTQYPETETYQKGRRGINEYTCHVTTPAFFEPERILVTLFTWRTHGKIGQGYYDIVSGNQIPPLLGVVPSAAASPVFTLSDTLSWLPALRTGTLDSDEIKPSSKAASDTCTGRTVILCRENDEDLIRLFIRFFSTVTNEQLSETLSLDELMEHFPDVIIDLRMQALPYEVMEYESEVEKSGIEPHNNNNGLRLPSSLRPMSSETGKKLLLAHKHKALSDNKVVEMARDYVYAPKVVHIANKDRSNSPNQGSKVTRQMNKVARENTERRLQQERKSTSTEDSKSRGPPPIPTCYKVSVENGRSSEGSTDHNVLMSDTVSASTLGSATSKSSSNSDRKVPPRPPTRKCPPWPLHQRSTTTQKTNENRSGWCRRPEHGCSAHSN